MYTVAVVKFLKNGRFELSEMLCDSSVKRLHTSEKVAILLAAE